MAYCKAGLAPVGWSASLLFVSNKIRFLVVAGQYDSYEVVHIFTTLVGEYMQQT